MPEPQFDIVLRNKNGGVVFYNSSRGQLTTPNNMLMRQSNAPMTKFKIEGPSCTFQFKGPEGSSSCDKALDIAKIIALSRR